MDLTETSMKRLANLKEVTEAPSYTEVIKNALKLYEDVINESREGKKIFLRGKDNEVVEYRIFS